MICATGNIHFPVYVFELYAMALALVFAINHVRYYSWITGYVAWFVVCSGLGCRCDRQELVVVGSYDRWLIMRKVEYKLLVYVHQVFTIVV